MVHRSVPVPAFYQILYPTPSFVLISPQEEIAFSTHTLWGRIHAPLHILTTTSFCVTPSIPSCTPTPKLTKSLSFLADQNGKPEKMSMYSSILSLDLNEYRIPKLESGAGCSGCGGYNLEKALKWDPSHFKKFKDYVHQLIDNHCNTSKSKKNQTPTALNSIEKELKPSFRMYCLMAFLSLHPDEDPTGSTNESYLLQELYPTHTYPPTPQPATSSATIHAYPFKSTLLNEDFAMAVYNPWGASRWMREEEDQHVSLLIPFFVS
ncbi:hypothetical protein BDR06DRAFT_1008976 [Suillus hirtellus]|nr:hypothetical protein BDR06DRAFT_1008976 [Suillus hirtellus]